ncbi:hypothetical protein CR513_25797, partial [Mucuna pruriens]
MELRRIGCICTQYSSTPRRHEAHVFREVLSDIKTATIKKEICGIRQNSRETLHEYWERFNKLCATYLTMMNRNMIDAASGGALRDKTPTATRHLISNMASNTQ